MICHDNFAHVGGEDDFLDARPTGSVKGRFEADEGLPGFEIDDAPQVVGDNKMVRAMPLKADFEATGFRKAANEQLYVLPQPPVGGGLTGQAARDAMAAVPFGM